MCITSNVIVDMKAPLKYKALCKYFQYCIDISFKIRYMHLHVIHTYVYIWDIYVQVYVFIYLYFI